VCFYLQPCSGFKSQANAKYKCLKGVGFFFLMPLWLKKEKGKWEQKQNRRKQLHVQGKEKIVRNRIRMLKIECPGTAPLQTEKSLHHKPVFFPFSFFFCL